MVHRRPEVAGIDRAETRRGDTDGGERAKERAGMDGWRRERGGNREKEK